MSALAAAAIALTGVVSLRKDRMDGMGGGDGGAHEPAPPASPPRQPPPNRPGDAPRSLFERFHSANEASRQRQLPIIGGGAT